MLDVFSALLVASANPLCVPLPIPSGATVSAQQPTYEALYRSGRTWEAFYDAAVERRQMWEENAARAAVPDDLLARARAVEGSWYLLVVAVDGCSDSVNSIPYIAKLAEQVEGLELRIIGRDAGKAIMESHRTPDDRPATPTVLLLNERFEEAGCWVERPSKLQAWYLEQKDKVAQRELTERKMAWYREDAGRETLREMVLMLEGAVAAQPVCSATQYANPGTHSPPAGAGRRP